MNPSVARGSAWGETVDRGEGHIAVMIPYVHYRKVQAYLQAIGSPLKPDDLIVSVLEGWLGRLRL